MSKGVFQVQVGMGIFAPVAVAVQKGSRDLSVTDKKLKNVLSLKSLTLCNWRFWVF